VSGPPGLSPLPEGAKSAATNSLRETRHVRASRYFGGFPVYRDLINCTQNHTHEKEGTVTHSLLSAGPYCQLLILLLDIGCDAHRLRLGFVHRQFFLLQALTKL